MPAYMETKVSDYNGDRKCFKCELTSTKEIKIGEIPMSFNSGKGYRSEFYCDNHFKDWIDKQSIEQPDMIDYLRKKLLDGGMSEIEVNEMIMKIFSPKEKA